MQFITEYTMSEMICAMVAPRTGYEIGDCDSFDDDEPGDTVASMTGPLFDKLGGGRPSSADQQGEHLQLFSRLW